MKNSMTINLLLLMIIGCNLSCTKEFESIDSRARTFIRESKPIGDYYVATWGDDNNPGTYEKPWGTWQKAFSTAQPGDLVYFRGGTWYRQQDEPLPKINVRDRIGKSGTKNNPTRFFAYPPDIAKGDSVIYDCINHLPGGEIPEEGWNVGISISGADHLHFKGLTVRNVWQGRPFIHCIGIGIIGCTNITLENMTVYNIGGRGIYYDPRFDSDSSYFINIDTYNCYNTFPNNQYQLDRDRTGSDGKGLFIVTYDQGEIKNYAEVRGSRAWNCSDDGWNICSGSTALVTNSWTFLNGVAESASIGGGGNGYKVNLVGKSWYDDPHQVNHKIFNVISALNSGPGYTENANGMHSVNRQVYNNIAYKNGSTGFAIQGWHPTDWEKRNNEYINNIGYANIYTDFGEFQGGYAYTNLTNSWTNPPGVMVTDTDFVNINDEDIIAQLKAPRKSDGSLPDITVFRLAENSKLKGAGTNVGMSQNPNIGIDWKYLDEKQGNASLNLLKRLSQ